MKSFPLWYSKTVQNVKTKSHKLHNLSKNLTNSVLHLKKNDNEDTIIPISISYKNVRRLIVIPVYLIQRGQIYIIHI